MTEQPRRRTGRQITAELEPEAWDGPLQRARGSLFGLSKSREVAQRLKTRRVNVAHGDFDADGKKDLAVYRPSSGTWFWLKSSAKNTQWEYLG